MVLPTSQLHAVGRRQVRDEPHGGRPFGRPRDKVLRIWLNVGTVLAVHPTTTEQVLQSARLVHDVVRTGRYSAERLHHVGHGGMLRRRRGAVITGTAARKKVERLHAVLHPINGRGGQRVGGRTSGPAAAESSI